jgi:D-alanyl-D-alanine carboxypeptidase/D-alanyl-D-alanine-endopeptidase (penicillin-binding protein 4)
MSTVLLLRRFFYFLLPIVIGMNFAFSSCSIQKQIARSATETVLNTPALQTAHVGISIYEPATNKYWYNYQGNKYFVPASNTKIPTCYAAMKYLGDSLVGLRYGYSEEQDTNYTILAIQPTGDPTLLHSDFKKQSVWNFLSAKADRYKESIAILDTIWQDDHWGSGWSWNDYDASYMAERNSFPIYGNVIDVKLNPLNKREINDTNYPQLGTVKLFATQNRYFDLMLNNQPYLILPQNLLADHPKISIKRQLDKNSFSFEEINGSFQNTSIPFVTNDNQTAQAIISDTLKIRFGYLRPINDSLFTKNDPDGRIVSIKIKQWYKIHSQPTDSLLKPMMHRSDNFFAEQSLLMVSNERLGIMNDEKIIDTLLKTDFKDLPQKPRWVDGSGLSRYNLFTPQDFIAILNKMKNEFGMERIKVILPTGGEGTISNYYKTDSGFIYAKTGSLSGVIAFSGFLYTKKNKLLIFSTLINNHQASATDVRRAIEKFLQKLRSDY